MREGRVVWPLVLGCFGRSLVAPAFWRARLGLAGALAQKPTVLKAFSAWLTIAFCRNLLKGAITRASTKRSFLGLAWLLRNMSCSGCEICPETQYGKQNPQTVCTNEFLYYIIDAMKIGYARVSTDDQNLHLQVDALEQAGCEKIYRDRLGGGKTEQPGLQEALTYLRPGDTLVVWRLDRLGRSLKHLIEIVTSLEEKGIGFQSVQESIDTTTSGGRLVFHIFGALAEFERNLIRERTQAGLQAARARGRKGGRPKALDMKKAALLYQLYDEKKHSIQELCDILGISKSTLYGYLEHRKPSDPA
jgi:DNA invertase Pin-like site-specific DNA recombinase